MSNYIINGLNIDQEIGFVPNSNRTTSNSFDIPNTYKMPLSHDWGDENGIEYDLISELEMLPRLFVLDGFIHATSEADYIIKKQKLEMIKLSGLLLINVPELSTIVYARFKKYELWERLTPIKGQTTIVTRVVLHLHEILDKSFTTKKPMKFTLLNYAAMQALIPHELPGLYYEYSIMHDEENGGGFPAMYLSVDGNRVRLIPQQAN